jgi:hypothetical protein
MAGRTETTNLQFRISINGEEKVLTSIKEVKKQRAILNKEIENGNLSIEEYNRKVKELQKLNAVLSDHRKKVRGVGESASGLSKVFGKIGPAIATAFGPITLILTAVNYLVQMTMATIRASQEMQKLRERVNQVSGLVGDDLNEAAASAQALANTFQVDLTKGVDAANAAANAYRKEGQDLGEVFNQSLDGIAIRLAALDGKGDEFLDQITEYSVQAKEAGLGIDEFFNLVTAGINRGIPTDKLIDSVKEFDIRIKTLTKGQAETLDQAFGRDFTDKLVSNIETGKTTSIEALREMAGEIDGLGENSAAARRVMSELFGGPGEDATASFLQIIQDVDGNLNTVIDTSNRYYRQKQELFELEKEANLATAELSQQLDGTGSIFTKIGLLLKTNFTRFLAEAIEFIRYFPEYFSAATSSWRSWANVVLGGIEAIIFKFNPFVKLLEKITGVEFKLPRFDIEDDPYGDVKKKIEADRKAFAENQRQQALIDAGKEEAAKLLAQKQAEERRQSALAKQREEGRQRELEKQLELEAQVQQRIEDLQIALMEEGLEKKIRLAEVAAEREIEALKGSAQQIATQRELIEKQLQQKIEALRNADLAKRKSDEEKLLNELDKARKEQFDNRKKLLEKTNAEEALLITQQVVLEVEAGAEIEDLDKEVKARLLARQVEWLEQKKMLYEEYGQDTTEIEQKIADINLNALSSPEGEGGSGDEPEWLAKVEKAVEAYSALSDFVSARNELRYKKELSTLEEQKEKELALAGDNEARKAKIEENFNKKSEELEKTYAKKEKRIAITNAVINTALSVTKALASAPPPGNFVTAAINAAAGAAQIAIMQAQQFAFGGILPEESKPKVPQRAAVGAPAPGQSTFSVIKEVVRSQVVPGRGGLPFGPSHSEGHIFLVDGRSGEIRGAIEGGEPILSKETYKNNREVVDRLLVSSMKEGGKRVYEKGGVLGRTDTHTSGFTEGATKIYEKGGILSRTKIYQTGGIEGSVFNATNTTVTNDVVQNTTSNSEIARFTEKVEELSQAYRAGKRILVGEKEAELFNEVNSDYEEGKVRRAL